MCVAQSLPAPPWGMPCTLPIWCMRVNPLFPRTSIYLYHIFHPRFFADTLRNATEAYDGTQTVTFQHRTCVMPSAICLHALLPMSGPFAIFLRCMLICHTPSFSISRCLQYITSLFLAWFFTSVFSLVPPTCLLVSQLHWLFVLLDCKYSSACGEEISQVNFAL